MRSSSLQPFFITLSLATAAATFFLSSGAFAAGNCKNDAECGAGFYCDISSPPSIGCGSKDGNSADCEQPAPQETSGYCREQAINCTTDAQCPAYLTCKNVSMGDTACSSPTCPQGQEDGCISEPSCETPKENPDAQKICAPKIIECSSNSVCPEGFACNISIGSGCSTIGCNPDDPSCKPDKPSDCEPDIKKYCGPKEIECKTDADCPTDWNCLSFEEGSCGGYNPDDPPAQDPSDAGSTPVPGSKSQDSNNCTISTRNLCAPKGYLAGIDSGGGMKDAKGSQLAESGGKDKTAGAPNYSAPNLESSTNNAVPTANNEDSGCSMNPRSQSTGILSLLMVGFAARLARRRSR